MRLLYTFSVRCYFIAILIASLFNAKARLWLSGRRKLFERIKSIKKGPGPTLWFHCASLGEFEQGRPIMEKLKSQFPDSIIVLTFFSPSGYEVRKNYTGADPIVYLPLDTPGNARKFVELVRPDAAVFIKYEFWYNYLDALRKKNIPLYLASGLFRPGHIFFRKRGAWFREQLKAFRHFFVQDEASELLLKQAGFSHVTVSGDTRFDRVCTIAAEKKDIPIAAAFRNAHNVLICGSTWDKDEELFANGQWLADAGWKLIIAPHEINERRLHSIEQRFGALNCLRYSKANSENASTAGVLIIDNIGMLASLYRYGNVAYVGGGFGDGIHSILEAAVFGIPVLFGPNHGKFIEARELIEQGGGFCVSNADSLRQTFGLLNQDAMILKMASMSSRNYVISKKGATEKVTSVIAKQLTS